MAHAPDPRPDVLPETAGRTAEAPVRLDWVDVAKAAAIVLVVVYHVALTGTAYLLPGSSDWGAEFWRGVSRYLLPVRMPLFFLVSGVLAKAALARPWHLLWRPKVGNLLWPFALWSLAYAPAFALGYGYGSTSRRRAALDQLEAAAWGGGAYWYLALLVVFVLSARLLRSHGVPVLVVATAAWLAAPDVGRLADELPEDLVTTLSRLCSFGVWFFAGCFARPLVERLAALRGWVLPLLASLGFLGLAAWIYGLGGAPRYAPHVASVLGVAASVAWAVRVSHLSPVRRSARVLAGRTLPVYVVHPLILTLAVAATRRADGQSGVPGGNPVVGLLFTPVVTTLLVVAALALHRLAGTIRAPWLFQAPSWWASRRRSRSRGDERPDGG